MTAPTWTPERFCALQTALGLTNPQMAARLLISRSSVEKWRTGERHPRRHVVRQLDKLEAGVRDD